MVMRNENVNHLLQLHEMPYQIISKLLMENENIWKLLKYSTADALSKPNLTIDEKRLLIYNGEENSTPFRVFRSSFTDDALAEECSRLHVYINTVWATNNIHGKTDFTFEVFSHNKIIALQDYLNRNEVLLSELVNTLNDQYIGGIGNLYFNYKANYTNMAKITYFNKFYQGYRLTMTNNNV